MERNELIMFSTKTTYAEYMILRNISKKTFQECLDKGFFIKVEEDKYRFTDKGLQFAWKN